jgi:hypothetical protein
MRISRLNINDSTFKNQDFLDLTLALQDHESKRVVVMYKEDGVPGLSSKRTEYVKNLHTNECIMTKNKGKHCSQKIAVVKDFSTKQFIIQYL